MSERQSGGAGKRILFLSDVLCLGGKGGAERSIVHLSAELRGRGFEVSAVFPRSPGSDVAIEQLRRESLEAEAHPAMLSCEVPRRAADVLALRALVEERRPDVVGLHTGWSWVRVSDVAAIRLAGRRCVVSVHSLDAATERRQRVTTVLASLLTDAVVVHSAAVRNVLLSYRVAPDRIRHVRYGLPPLAGIPSKLGARERLGVERDAFVVASLSRLIPRKRTIDVLLALARLGDLPKIVLLVGGIGPEREALERRAEELKLGDRVRFLGLVRDPMDVYAASDLFVMPSRNDAFPLVFMEAAQFGLPRIGVGEGGVVEAIEDCVTGLLVPPEDPDALARAMRRLFDDPVLRHRLAEAGRARIEQDHSVAATADAYLRAAGLDPSGHVADSSSPEGVAALAP